MGKQNSGASQTVPLLLEDNMKKSAIITLIAISILLLGIIAIMFIRNNYKNYYASYYSQENEKVNINLTVKRIIILPLDEGDLTDIKKYSKFNSELPLSDNVKNDLLKDPFKYKRLAFEYDFGNSSEDTAIMGIKIDPLFDERLSENVIGYASEIADTPGARKFKAGRKEIFRRPILIKIDGKSNEEIFELAKMSKIKVSYYLGENQFELGWKSKVFDISPDVSFSTSY